MKRLLTAALATLAMAGCEREPSADADARMELRAGFEGPAQYAKDAITLNDDTRPYGHAIYIGINKLASKYPACKTLDPASVGLDGARSTEGNPLFFVFCTAGDKPARVNFSMSQLMTPTWLGVAAERVRPERAPDPDNAAAKAEQRQKRIREGFTMRGEHWELRELIRRNLHDPKSYEHIETRYVDKGGDVLEVVTRYRAKNAFGALVASTTLANVHIDGHVIEIVGTN